MNNRRWTATSSAALLLLVVVAVMTGRDMADAFVALSPVTRSVSSITRARRCSSSLHAQISEKEANVAINNVVKALQKDREANEELGRLQKVNNVLGYGSPKPGTIAVRFNASFRKAGKGLSSVPLPFGLGQSNESEGRGTMVGQASVDAKTNRVLDASVFRDLGYGRSFVLKV